jgi:hypothetical protein
VITGVLGILLLEFLGESINTSVSAATALPSLRAAASPARVARHHLVDAKYGTCGVTSRDGMHAAATLRGAHAPRERAVVVAAGEVDAFSGAHGGHRRADPQVLFRIAQEHERSIRAAAAAGRVFRQQGNAVAICVRAGTVGQRAEMILLPRVGDAVAIAVVGEQISHRRAVRAIHGERQLPQGHALIVSHSSHSVGGVFAPNGTFHRSPAHGAGWLASAWASVLQGRLMHSAATGDGEDGFGHWHLSRMRRPYRTRGFLGIQTRHGVPGFDEPSPYDRSPDRPHPSAWSRAAWWRTG